MYIIYQLKKTDWLVICSTICSTIFMKTYFFTHMSKNRNHHAWKQVEILINSVIISHVIYQLQKRTDRWFFHNIYSNIHFFTQMSYSRNHQNRSEYLINSVKKTFLWTNTLRGLLAHSYFVFKMSYEIFNLKHVNNFPVKTSVSNTAG